MSKMNHLIIGLGGTGGRIVRDLRKSIIQDFPDGGGRPIHKNGAEGQIPAANVDFLYIDTCRQDMEERSEFWTYMGHDISLDDTNRLLLTDSSMIESLQHINGFPQITPWLGDVAKWEPRVQGLEGVPGANQVRRLARYLLARNIESFINSLQALVSDLTASKTNKVTFHICCTTAGGTGSGCVVDTVAQIRKIYKSMDDFPIYVYGLITDRPQPEAQQNFYANQAAALSELNAMRVGLYKPHDLSAMTGQRVKQLGSFTACYLVSDENEQGIVIPKEQQEQVVADMIYHQAVVLQGAMPKELEDTFTFQDLANHQGEPAQHPERSYMFGAFGMKRWSIPEEEIRVRLTETLVQQASNQMIWNNWMTDGGFATRSAELDLMGYVKDEARNERWNLTDEHLTLAIDLKLAAKSQAVVDVAGIWEREVNRAEDFVERSFERMNRITALRKMVDEYYTSRFRGVGVVQFYNDRQSSKSVYASSLLRRIEADLHGAWSRGELSLNNLCDVLDTLCLRCDERIDGYESEIAKQRELYRQSVDKQRDFKVRYHSLNLCQRALGEPRKVMRAYSDALREEMVTGTRIKAYEFADVLLREIRQGLQSFSESTRMILTKALKVDDIVRAKLAALAQVSGDRDNAMHRVELDREAISLITHSMVKNQTLLESLSSQIRADLVSLVGAERSFDAMARKLTAYDMLASMEKRCEQEARAAHARLTQGTNSLRKVIGVSILDKLKEDHGEVVTDALKKQVREMVMNAVSAIRIDKNAVPSSIALDSPLIKPAPRRRVVVFLPEATDPADPFRRALAEVFSSCRPTGVEPIKVFPAPSGRGNEILIMSVTYWMPLRFLKAMTELNAQYQARTAEEDSHLEIHLEDNIELPSLEHGVEMNHVKSYLLMAEAMNLLQKEHDPQTGVDSFFLVERDSGGRQIGKPVTLGPDFMAAANQAKPEACRLLRRLVKGQLEEPAMRHRTHREEVAARMGVRIDQIFEERGRHTLDEPYQEWCMAHADASKMLEVSNNG